jgi:nucleotide-binding universal stress UspA family protein
MTAPTTSRARDRTRQIRTEPFRILVASDAEPGSLSAIRLATALARRRSASVHALIVATPFPHGMPSVPAIAPPAMLDADNRQASLERLRRQLATVRGTGEWTVRAKTGFAADSINDAAALWPASLIVMGAGRHNISDRLLGSETAVKVAADAAAPVLAVAPDADELPTRAIAAVDFSTISIEAALLGATLLGPNGVLTLFHASPLIVEGPAEEGSVTDVYTAGVRAKLAEVAQEIHRRSKRTVPFDVARGGIVDRLLELADGDACDLIVIGAHEVPFVERVLVGRLRTTIIRRAACSVLVVPPSRPLDP